MDNPEQPLQEFRPNTMVAFPALGPAFINPDDAAYWAHLQIGNKRDIEYGGVIVKRLADGRYLATQPHPGGSRSFDVRSILSTDSQDSPLFPDGFSCYAIYHSHDRASEGEKLYKNIFSKQDQYLILRWRFFARAHYLSGPSGSLLKYTASGTAAEDAYLALLHESVTKGVRIEGSRFAEVGDLRLLVTSPVWGVARGKIIITGTSADRPFPTTALTDQQPFFTQVFDQSAKAVDAVLGIAGAKSNGGCMGFILKAVGKDEYVATLPVAALAPLFSPTELFPSRANGGPKLPSNFRIDGIYYRSLPMPAQQPAKQAWLYENFFSPAELAAAIAQSRKDTYLQDGQRGLTLYMRARDNALLSYKCSRSESETELSVIRSDGIVEDGGTQARLMVGTLTTRDFVLQVAKAGELLVVQPGKVWDRLGVVGLDSAPFATFQWPVLSPVFLSADDAARYVHARIANKRDREYGGYIFQRKDQRFVASEPMESVASSLAYGLFYPTDNRGLSIFPEDHVLHARYGSHKALSMIDSAKVEALNWSRQEADVSAQMFRDEEIKEIILRDLPVYLSAAEHSFIMFKPGSPQAQEPLRQRLSTKNSTGKIALELENGTIKPSDVVKELAAAGDLRVVISSDLWGAVGNVSAQWAPFLAKNPREVPRQVAFGAIFSSADEAAEDMDSRGSGSYDTEQTSFGFILKHKDKEEYIATEFVPVSGVRDKLFSLTSLFGISRQGSYSFPPGFELDAYFYSKRGIEGYPAGPKTWLKQYFIDPMDLYVVVYNAQRRSVIRPDRVCPVYISTLEGALLKYLPRPATKLFDNDTPNMGLEVIQSNLANGALTPTDFVRVVAKSGQLSVLRSSLCWDRKGAVDTHWFRYMNLQRRPLSPAFLTADDAARYVRAQLFARRDNAYGGLILRRPDGFYLATEPVPVPREDFDFSWIFRDESTITGQFPAGGEIVARYRSRTQKELPFLLSQTEKQVYLNMLSPKTLRTAFGRRRDRIDEYLIGPDGSLIRYLPDVFTIGVFDMERNLVDYHLLPDTLKANSIKYQIHTGVLKPSEWINRLGSMGTLQIVVGSKLWGPARWAITWTPNPEPVLSETGYSKAITEPAYSPVFAQEKGAARYVHEQVGSRDALEFGFILKYSRGDLYTASMPLEAEGSNFAYDSVFLDGSLPYRYDVQSLYLCAEKSPVNLLDEDHRHFFSPMDVQHARVRADTPQGFKPIYFSCADGALLKFKLDSFDPELSLDKFGQVEFRPNPFASLEQAQNDQRDITSGVFKLSSYIQRMAKAGNLEVLITSPYWSRQGNVSPDWKPRMAPTASAELATDRPVLALGPIFHHADDAARYVQLRAGGFDDTGTVYESAILTDSGGTSFVPLEPLVIPVNSDQVLERVFRTTPPDKTPRFPDGYKLMATHQLYQSGNSLNADDPDSVHDNFISSSLLNAHTYGPKAKGFAISDHYYSSPYGALLRYTPVYSTAEEALLLTKQISFSDGHWVTHLTAGEFISSLASFGHLRVLAAGGYWQQIGRVVADWRISRQHKSEESTVRTRDEL